MWWCKMEKEQFVSLILQNQKARFGDELEFAKSAELLDFIPKSKREDFILRLKFFSKKGNLQGFYGLKELSEILAKEILEQTNAKARQSRLKNYRGSDESAFFILQRFFIDKHLANAPAWFVDFVLDILAKEGSNA